MMKMPASSTIASSFVSGDIVWVRQGKTDHQAIVTNDYKGRHDRIQIKWTGTNAIDYVSRSTAKKDLVVGSRRRRTRIKVVNYNEDKKDSELLSTPTQKTKEQETNIIV